MQERTLSLNVIGTTTSEKEVVLFQEPSEYKNFTKEDHAEASLFYNDRRVKYKLTRKAEDLHLELEHKHNQLSK